MSYSALTRKLYLINLYDYSDVHVTRMSSKQSAFEVFTREVIAAMKEEDPDCVVEVIPVQTAHKLKLALNEIRFDVRMARVGTYTVGPFPTAGTEQLMDASAHMELLAIPILLFAAGMQWLSGMIRHTVRRSKIFYIHGDFHRSGESSEFIALTPKAGLVPDIMVFRTASFALAKKITGKKILNSTVYAFVGLSIPFLLVEWFPYIGIITGTISLSLTGLAVFLIYKRNLPKWRLTSLLVFSLHFLTTLFSIWASFQILAT